MTATIFFSGFEAALVVAVAADGLAVDAAKMDLRLRWWWQWQQIDELSEKKSRHHVIVSSGWWSYQTGHFPEGGAARGDDQRIALSAG